MFLDYLLQLHLDECCSILAQDDVLRHYSVCIDFLKLFELYPDIGDSVLCSPVETLANCDRDLVSAQQRITSDDRYKERLADKQNCSVKRNVHARFYGLPVCPELHRTVFPKNVDVGCFLKVTGTVVRVTESKMLEYRRTYKCLKCRHETTVEGGFEERFVLRAPTRCGNPATQCKSCNFAPLNLVSREHCKDYQELKIQEQVNKLNIGTIPGSMWVTVEDDLVDSCKPGDDINVCGVVRRRWHPPTAGKKCSVELVLHANHAEVCNAQRSRAVAAAPDVAVCFHDYWTTYRSCPVKGRDNILATVCPQVYGLHLVKLALLLTVVTGSGAVADAARESAPSTDDQHRLNVRGQCHLLLVGDPGTGKSQLLRAGAELTPRSVFTSGTGSTRAGLTCAALREDGEWQLEAGALVLSDGGVCCIDEIGQLREHDRCSIHEAMEQQTISIAKAGIVCKLNTRCAVIGACNPKGHYQTDQPLSANVSLGTPLLSRFDLIFILLDTKNEEWDKLVSSYILFGSNSDSVPTRGRAWSIEKLQMYIASVAARRTHMSKSARTVLQTYYMLQRRSQHRDVARTTVRSLDSLVRLSQAHCRLMFREQVSIADAVTAVRLVDLSMQDCTLRDTTDALHSTFPKHPDFHYLCTAKRLLTDMKLHEIWNEELLCYSKLLNVDHKTLASEIDKGSYRLFAKYDDVADDNIPLSCSLVTSSYFKKIDNSDQAGAGSSEQLNANVRPAEEKCEEINVKLAETLKKHSSMNKVVKQPIPKVKNVRGAKRKIKEIAVDIEVLNNGHSNVRKGSKVVKRNRKQSNKVKKSKDNNSDSSEENFYPVNILNHVPSVNDIFVDLGVNLNYEDGSPIQEENSENTRIEMINESITIDTAEQNETDKNINLDKEKDKTALSVKDKNISASANSSSSLRESKLKQFQFIQKRDLNKFYEPTTKSEPNGSAECTNTEPIDVLCANNKTNSVINNISRSNSAISSQISMFETYDCDLDLEL